MSRKKIVINKVAKLNLSTLNKSDNFSEIQYLDTGNIIKNNISKLQLLNLKRDKIPSRAKRKVKKNTIIYSTVRPNQEHYGFLNNPSENLIVSTGFTTIDVDDASIDPKFIYYLITQRYVTDYLHGVGMNAVSSYPSIKPEDLGNLKFEIPKKLVSQQNIASLLTTIDKKIELNNKINAELEKMAKTLYDYWFVQFDFPDENDKPYKSSGGEMVWSDELKREIPEEWEVKRIDQIESNIITGKTPSTKVPENFNGEVPFICIGDVRGNMHIVKTEITLSKKGAETQRNKYIPEGTICVTCIASPGLVGFATKESQTNQQLNSIVCKRFENRYYLYFYLQDYFKYAKAKSGNTFANMNKEDFSSIKTIKPNDEILLKFANIIQPSIDNILTNTKENQKLAELRDWLLPMLMNGQVTVN